MFKKLSHLILSALLLLALGTGGALAAPTAQTDMTVVELAAEDGRFDTFVQALETAALVEELEGEGPFTIFAPTDEAFAKVSPATMDRLLSDPENLQQVLYYHVVPGRLMPADIAELTFADTRSGWQIDITHRDDGTVAVNDIPVLMTPLEAANGVIYPIDEVLLLALDTIYFTDAESGNMMDTLWRSPRMNTLVQLIETADLADVFSGQESYTLFAPSNKAFDELPAGTLDGLLADNAALTEVLQYHIVSGEVVRDELIEQQQINTLLGQPLNISVENETARINDRAQIEVFDVRTINGIVHLIDTVLLPEAPEEAAPPDEVTVEGLSVECVEDYVVQDADWLSKIADKYYGDIFAYPALVEATNAAAVAGGAYDAIADPDVIEVGQQVCIPSREDAEILLATDEQPLLRQPATENTISDILSTDDRFTTLTTALSTADLANTFNQEGPYTLFAPTNQAFEVLPEETWDTLLQNPDQLANVLLYHVLPGDQSRDEIRQLEFINTLNGEAITITESDGILQINTAEVSETIEAANGTVYVINRVLLPEETE